MNNPFNMIFNSVNPKQMFMNMMQNNPQIQQTLKTFQNSGNGASFEQMARMIAQQKGISEQQLMQMYNNLNR